LLAPNLRAIQQFNSSIFEGEKHEASAIWIRRFDSCRSDALGGSDAIDRNTATSVHRDAATAIHRDAAAPGVVAKERGI